jgi:ABC-type sugar transport system ATPase subunit
MYAVEFKQVTKKYRQHVPANRLNLKVRDGSFSVVFGAPGSGKSTLLRLITGLEQPDSGQICLRGEDVTHTPPGDRNIGYVPQSFALYPHYSVFDNIAYPLKLMGIAKAEYTPIVQQTAEQLQIAPLLQKRPDQCSGGEKQRVAIARGIVKNTKIFILDDPLTGLDFKLRERLFDDLREMKEDLAATFIYTTSDPLEALMLAEDVHIFDGGQVVEVGPLDEVYNNPRHVRTAELLGFPNTNMLAGKLTGGGGYCETDIFSFPIQAANSVGEVAVWVAIRPQDIVLNPEPNAGLVTSPADITLVEDLGGELHIYLRAGDVELETVVPHGSGQVIPTEGTATIGVDPSRFRLYGAQDSELISVGGS